MHLGLGARLGKIAIAAAISWPPYVYEKGMESEFVSPKHCLVNWAQVALRANMILMSLFSADTCLPTAFYVLSRVVDTGW